MSEPTQTSTAKTTPRPRPQSDKAQMFAAELQNALKNRNANCNINFATPIVKLSKPTVYACANLDNSSGRVSPTVGGYDSDAEGKRKQRSEAAIECVDKEIRKVN